MTNEEIIIGLREGDMATVQFIIYALLEEEKPFPSQSVARFRGRLENMVTNRECGYSVVRDSPCRLVFDRERDELPGRD